MSIKKLEGRSELSNGSGQSLKNHVSIEVGESGARLGADSPRLPNHLKPLQTANKDTARFLGRWVNQIEATADYFANRDRPVLADPKPIAADPPPVIQLREFEVVPCPNCNGEGWHLCPLCDGEACVTKHRAEEWRERHTGRSGQ